MSIREATAQDHARMLTELKREVGRLVVQTTATVTGKVTGGDEPAGVTTIFPLYVPAGKPAVLAVTASETGVLGVAVPVAGLRVSQLFCFPVSSAAAAVKASEPPPALRTATACVRVNEPWGKA